MAQVRAIEKTAMQGDLGAALKARGDAQHALDLLVWSQTSNVQAFAAAAQTLAMQATQVAMAQHQMALAVEAVLTEAQRTQLEALVAAPGRGRGRRGGGGSGGGGSSHP